LVATIALVESAIDAFGSFAHEEKEVGMQPQQIAVSIKSPQPVPKLWILLIIDSLAISVIPRRESGLRKCAIHESEGLVVYGEDSVA
jgi:hypothetical protein